jgi:hypothetical protein
MSKIFIAMPALYEEFIYDTVESAFLNADAPENLSFGIFSQHEKTFDYDFKTFSNRINFVQSDVKNVLGLGISRLNASALRQYDENFYFQIDAHTMFKKGWDSIILKEYNNLLNIHSKPIISMSTPFWTIENNKKIFSVDKNGILIGNPNLHSQAIGDEIIYWAGSIFSDHKESFFCSGHFIFSDISFLDEISPDPFIVFSEEQSILSIRACTRNYKIFSIKETICYHLDKNKITESNWKIKTNIFSEKRIRFARKRTIGIMSGDILGYWGAPDLNSLNQYYEKINVDIAGLVKQYRI